mmetsp:Transcript_37260/g.62640  ORF Transcript_37260/g.62640 Transcript_37260/m.62640 type:complete len:106 (+) Transcript_37260:632-949(+)
MLLFLVSICRHVDVHTCTIYNQQWTPVCTCHDVHCKPAYRIVKKFSSIDLSTQHFLQHQKSLIESDTLLSPVRVVGSRPVSSSVAVLALQKATMATEEEEGKSKL